MQKILLYYKFAPVADPEAVRLWQRTLCEKLNLKGRIIIADHGINGTVGGQVNDLKAYVSATHEHPAFKDIDFKWSNGGREDFPKLSIKVRPEIISFGVPDIIKVDDQGIIGAGQRLKPKQVHELVAKRGDDVIFFDGRNNYEAAIGKFKGAVTPAVGHTRDFAQELKDPRYDGLKDKPVITYCTGGIRCEVLSLVMKQRGFTEVYQLDGGIQKYGEEYGDDGLWEGSLYVFDGRMNQKFSDHTKDIGSCVDCSAKTSNYENCANKACNKLVLICTNCNQKIKTCGNSDCLTRDQLKQTA